jgi:hypothetical protein
MPSETEIANFALAAMGERFTIASLSEESNAARALDMFFETARNEMLREYDWPFARKRAALVMISDADEEYSQDYYYAYRYPSDCAFILRLLNGLQRESIAYKLAYKIIQDDDGLLILSNALFDEDEFNIEYISTETPISFWPPDAALALAYRVAFYAAPRIIGDASKLGPMLDQLYRMSRSKAKAQASNEEVNPDEPLPEFLTGR